MKYFIVFALIAAVASAAFKPNPEVAEIQEIIAAIQSPSTDPATAAALEQMLLESLGINPEPVAVGPAIVNPVEGISVGPAIVPFPLPDGGAVAEEPIIPSPVVVAPAPVAPAPVAAAPAASTPLVQIILNINQAESSPVSVGPAVTPEHVEIKPEPVHVVEEAHIEGSENWPVLAPGHVEIHPVEIVEVAPEPVHVVETAPVPAEPIQIGVPVLPEAAVVLPEELN